MEFDKEKYNDEMDYAAEYMHDHIMPMVNSLALDTTSATFVLSALRKRLNGLAAGKLQEATLDNRKRKWKYNFAIYNITQGVEGSSMQEQGEVEEVRGLDTVVRDLQTYLADVHHEDEFDPEIREVTSIPFLKRRFGGMRPAISKYGGRASTSIQYKVGNDKFLVFIRLAHAELELDKDLLAGQY